MSAMRAVSRPARSLSSNLVRQRRFASHDSHDSHHHESHDSTVYPKEGFTGPIWRNTAIAALGLYAVANFLPEILEGSTSEDGEHEAPWLTRVLAFHAPSIEEWARTNGQHLVQVEELARNAFIVQTAKPSPVVRYKNPLKFEQVSPHRTPVGGMSDMSDLVVKP
ncbi:hypothetical protein DFH11DRAFT_1540196 [Phellopilus nigrolimitatus]|nr:hypothetical protein DFH11DRAFT_1540196 [Phellopilus nigrolimitatus]